MKKWLIAAGVVTAAGVLWYQTRPLPPAINLTTVERGMVEATVSNTRAGTIKACQRSKLSMPIGGRVAQLAVDEGDRVQAGQALITLWNEDRVAMLAQSQAALRSASTRVKQACLTAERDQRDLERVRSLQHKKLISEDVVDRANTLALTSQAACDGAQADESTARATLALHQAQLDETILRAPFAGVVAEINGEVGEYVTPSPPGVATPPAVDLIDDSCLYVSAPIDEVDAASVRVGMPARVSLDAFRGRQFTGEVSRIAPYVLDLEKQARTVAVDVKLTELPKDVALLVGYSADIEVILDAREGIRIPTEAILSGNKVLRFNPETSTLEEQKIERGIGNWSFAEITEGLQAGDRIITSLEQDGATAGNRVTPAP